MDHWRQKAIGIFPEREREFSDDVLTHSIYGLFYHDMLEIWESAALKDDIELARRILSLVEWGLTDVDYDVRNATNVSFLEHIPDKALRLHFAERVMPEHLFRRAIELSAYLRKSDQTWRPHLEESLSHYNDLHHTHVTIEWP